MRVVLNIVGAALAFFGSVWFLQGINVLPDSFMTGQMKWAVYGGIAFVAGVVLLVAANKAACCALVSGMCPLGHKFSITRSHCQNS